MVRGPVEGTTDLGDPHVTFYEFQAELSVVLTNIPNSRFVGTRKTPPFGVPIADAMADIDEQMLRSSSDAVQYM